MRRPGITLAFVLGLGAWATSALAAEPGPKAPKGPVTDPESQALERRVDELDREVKALRALLRRTGDALRDAAGPAPKSEPEIKLDPIVLPPPTDPPPPPKRAQKDDPAGSTPKALGTIRGRALMNGTPIPRTHVYLIDLPERPEPPSKPPLVILQKDKLFKPNFAVVRRGRAVTFPNADLILHAVHSASPSNKFELGMYSRGDPERSVRLVNPGVVEVRCSIHSEMNATIVVVPNMKHTTEAKADGTFELKGLPPGEHVFEAWAPGARPVRHKVTVIIGQSVDVSFELARRELAGSR